MSSIIYTISIYGQGKVVPCCLALTNIVRHVPSQPIPSVPPFVPITCANACSV